jgi:hypothetical protein
MKQAEPDMLINDKKCLIRKVTENDPFGRGARQIKLKMR